MVDVKVGFVNKETEFRDNKKKNMLHIFKPLAGYHIWLTLINVLFLLYTPRQIIHMYNFIHIYLVPTYSYIFIEFRV